MPPAPDKIKIRCLKPQGQVTQLRGGVTKVRWTPENPVRELSRADAMDLLTLGAGFILEPAVAAAKPPKTTDQTPPPPKE
jgi:hypothetical protein